MAGNSKIQQSAKDESKNKRGPSRRRVLNILKGLTLGIGAGLVAGRDALTAFAQQIFGTPGSPSATTTIDGAQLPAPPQKFEGKIEREATKSTPYWPARIVPPMGAPNVLLIITDDAGYGVASTFGGVIPTPALDRIARDGLRYTNFHSTALCSPTRAALITGRNHHSVGYGVIAERRPGIQAMTA
jgi:arylsulfatase